MDITGLSRPLPYILNNGKTDHQTDEKTSSVAYKGQGQAGNRQKAQVHSHIYDYMRKKINQKHGNEKF